MITAQNENRNRLILLSAAVAAIILGTQVIAYVGRLHLDRPQLAARPDPDTAIAFWQGRTEQIPDAYLDYTYLGEAYLRKARTTGDTAHYSEAQAAFERALEINPRYPQAALSLASVHLAYHDFQGAIDLARPFTADPRAGPQAAFLIGDALLALGDYEEAEAVYQRATTPGEVTASVLIRQANLADLRGDAESALSLYSQAAAMAWESGDYPENLAWYESQLGTLSFERGDLRGAERQFRTSLEVLDGYLPPILGLAEVKAAQGQFETAIEIYLGVPDTVFEPAIPLALGDLFTILGRTDEAQEQYAKAESMFAIELASPFAHRREVSLYFSDRERQLERSLSLAREELSLRQDVASYDTFAWALYKNGLFTEAAEAIEKAMALGTRDALFYYHAGMIYLSLGDRAAAESFLAEALAINPYFDLMQAPIASETLQALRSNP